MARADKASQQLAKSETTAPATLPVRSTPIETTTSRNAGGLGSAIRGPVVWGMVTVLFFFGGFGGWAATAPIAGATIAPGTVSPDSQRKSIQHLEGGIVREINVREGSQVKAGDVLVTLLDIKARSTFEQDALKKYGLEAKRTRLEAELALLTPTEPVTPVASDANPEVAGLANTTAPQELTFSAELEELAQERPGFAQLLEGERQQFFARQVSYEVSLKLLYQTIAKSRTEISQLEDQAEAIVRQSELLDEEIEIVQGLFEQNLESGSRLLDLKRERFQMDEDRAALTVRMGSARETIASVTLEIDNQRATRLEEITNDLATLRSDLQTTEERMRSNEDALTRTVVRSPVDGTVVDMQVHTIGGVVGAGQVIMDIVPQNDRLIIDAHIALNDIDSVHQGQPVQVVLLAYPQRRMPVIDGTLIGVSADALVDEEGNSYFLGHVEVDEAVLQEIDPHIRLIPGMQVELKIVTEERTFIDYLLDPLIRSLGRTFVEA